MITGSNRGGGGGGGGTRLTIPWIIMSVSVTSQQRVTL